MIHQNNDDLIIFTAIIEFAEYIWFSFELLPVCVYTYYLLKVGIQPYCVFSLFQVFTRLLEFSVMLYLELPLFLVVQCE